MAGVVRVVFGLGNHCHVVYKGRFAFREFIVLVVVLVMVESPAVVLVFEGALRDAAALDLRLIVQIGLCKFDIVVFHVFELLQEPFGFVDDVVELVFLHCEGRFVAFMVW